MRRGDAGLEADQLGDACHSYLGAAEYYWLALRETELASAERCRIEDAHVSAFRAAVPLLPHRTTPFDLDVEGVAVRGYLFMPTAVAKAAPTIIWPVEGEATVAST
ncbi:MAG: hypothetical protein ABI368_12075, partial [Jatrophihabitantaceae bacterium]